jgi:hypothetical protein
MKTLIDRVDTTNVRTLDHMIAELSPHMNYLEIDRAVDLLNTLATSKFDVNLTVDDASSQLKLLFGSERYEQIKYHWSVKNQHLIPNGKKKYYRISDGTIWDGLDPEDDPSDYNVIYM